MNYVLDDIIKGIVYDKDPFISDADDVGIEFMDFFRESINEYFNVQFKKGDIVLYEIHKTLPLKHKGITRQNFLPAVRYLGNKPEFTKLLLRDGFKETISLLLNGNLNYDEKKQFLINTSRNNELYDDIERKTQETFQQDYLRRICINPFPNQEIAENALSHPDDTGLQLYASLDQIMPYRKDLRDLAEMFKKS